MGVYKLDDFLIKPSEYPWGVLPPPPLPLAWDSDSVKTIFNASHATVSIARPGGLEAGNMILVFISGRAQTTITPPGGFELIGYGGSNVNSLRPFAAAFWKTATDDEPASYQFSFGVDWYGKRLVSGRVLNASGIDRVGTTHTEQNSVSSVTIPGITPTVSRSLLFAQAGIRVNQASIGIPADMELVFQHLSDVYATTSCAMLELDSDDPTGGKTFTFASAERAGCLMFNVY